MITSSDSEYKATKRIKQGQARLEHPFDELAAWIATTWGVTVLNVIYDRANDLRAPRLQVILEHRCDAEAFRDGYNYDAKKQQAIKAHFLDIINRQPSHGYDVDGLFVVFSAFAPIAKAEADSKLSEQQIEALKNRLANPDLWVISRCFGHVTFMFYTNEQVSKHEANGEKEEYAGKYFEILKPKDEFGYLSLQDFIVSFDSKQNFDDNYKSNWYYYYK